MSALSSQIEDVKVVLRGLLISSASKMTAENLYRDYRSNEGQDVPFRLFGYNTFLEFLRSIPDVVKIENSPWSTNPVVTPVVSQKSSHVDALVQKQKINPPKKKYGRRTIVPVRRSAVTLQPPPKPNALVPFSVQEKIVEMVNQRPQGVPVSFVREKLNRNVLRNFGINCEVEELLQNLGHIIRFAHGWVYPLQEPSHRSMFPDEQPLTPMFQKLDSPKYVPRRMQVSNGSERQNNCDTKSSVGSGDVFSERKTSSREDSGDSGRIKYEYTESWKISPAGDENNYENGGYDELALVVEEDDLSDAGGGGDTPLNPNMKAMTPSPEPLSSPDCLKRSRSPECSTGVVSNTMKNNIRRLLEENPDGISCSDLPRLYKENFKVDLDYLALGFVSVVQLVSKLTDVFHYVRLDGSNWKLLDIRKPMPEKYKKYAVNSETKVYTIPEPDVPVKIRNNIERLLKYFPSGLRSDQFLEKYQSMFGRPIDIQSMYFDTLESFLLYLNDSALHVRYVHEKILVYPHAKDPEPEENQPLPHLTQMSEQLFMDLFPKEVVGPKERIPLQKLPPGTKPGDYLEVLVSEVYNPHRFWVQLRGEKTHLALDNLMNDIQSFYSEDVDYKMPDATIKVGQVCAAPYCDELHRAVIMDVPNLQEVEVQFIDYGTIGKVPKRELKFLHQDFAKLPAQALKASLVNVKPPDGAKKWNRRSSKRFLELASDRDLVATITSVDHETRELEVALADTSGKDDIHINDLLKEEGYAAFINDKPSIPCPSGTPPPEQRIESVPVKMTSTAVPRPPPGFIGTSTSSVSLPESTSPVFSTAASLNTSTRTTQSVKPGVTQPLQSSYIPPTTMSSFDSSLFNLPFVPNANPLLLQSQMYNMQQQQYQQIVALEQARQAMMIHNPAMAAVLYAQQMAIANTIVTAAAVANSAMGGGLTNPAVGNLTNTALANALANSVLNSAALTNPLGVGVPNSGMGTGLRNPAFASGLGNTFSSAGIGNIPFANTMTNTSVGNAFTSSFGVPYQNPSTVYTSQTSTTSTDSSSLEVNISEVPCTPSKTSPVEESSSQQATSSPVVTSPPSPLCSQEYSGRIPESFTSDVESLNLQMSKVNIVNVPGTSEAPKRPGMLSESTSSTASSALEQFEVVPARPEINMAEDMDDSDDLIYRSDDEELEEDDPDVIVENETIVREAKAKSKVKEQRQQLIKKTKLAQHEVHILNVSSRPYFCTDEVVRKYTDFSGGHVILKILDSKGVNLNFRELSRRDAPDVMEALEKLDVIGIQKSFLTGTIMGKVHLTPLEIMPQLMTLLNLKNREVYRAVQEEIDRYHRSGEAYWMEEGPESSS